MIEKVSIQGLITKIKKNQSNSSNNAITLDACVVMVMTLNDTLLFIFFPKEVINIFFRNVNQSLQDDIFLTWIDSVLFDQNEV